MKKSSILIIVTLFLLFAQFAGPVSADTVLESGSTYPETGSRLTIHMRESSDRWHMLTHVPARERV